MTHRQNDLKRMTQKRLDTRKSDPRMNDPRKTDPQHDWPPQKEWPHQCYATVCNQISGCAGQLRSVKGLDSLMIQTNLLYVLSLVGISNRDVWPVWLQIRGLSLFINYNQD